MFYLWLVIRPEGHPHPRYDFGSEVDWSALPQWSQTNEPPISMQDAIRLARAELENEAAPIGTWKLHSVGLGDAGRDRWTYDLLFIESNGKHRTELVRVLLDGRAAKMQWSN